MTRRFLQRPGLWTANSGYTAVTFKKSPWFQNQSNIVCNLCESSSAPFVLTLGRRTGGSNCQLTGCTGSMGRARLTLLTGSRPPPKRRPSRRRAPGSRKAVLNSGTDNGSFTASGVPEATSPSPRGARRGPYRAVGADPRYRSRLRPFRTSSRARPRRRSVHGNR